MFDKLRRLYLKLRERFFDLHSTDWQPAIVWEPVTTWRGEEVNPQDTGWVMRRRDRKNHVFVYRHMTEEEHDIEYSSWAAK